nr:MAG TPA: hypothetical protein [Caudoviricetes sp.]
MQMLPKLIISVKKFNKSDLIGKCKVIHLTVYQYQY